MAQEMQKNGNISPETLQQNPMAGNSMMQGMLGGFGQNNANPANMGMNMPFGGSNPFFPMMGSGFGMNPQSQQGFNFPYNNGGNMPSFGMFGNPFMMQQSMFNNNQSKQPETTQQQNSSLNSAGSNNFPSLFQNLQNVMQKANEEVQYSSQLKELSSMGFGDKEKNIKYLKESEGDIDKALEKLCLDDDQKEEENKAENKEKNGGN